MNRNQPVPEGAEVTLVFSDGRITGKSACNRYSAGIEEGDNAGDIKIGQSMSTMMACPEELMKVEHEYLDALSNVSSFSFHAGSLALNGQKKGGEPYSMHFSKTEINAQQLEN
jgi:heat shock protein HslJ